MSQIHTAPRGGLATIGAIALFAVTHAPAQAAIFTYDFTLSVGGVFDAGSGAVVPGSPLIGQTGSAALSFDIDTSTLSAGDTLDLDNDDVSSFEATILGQSFGKDDAADVTGSPFQPPLPSGDTPIASLVAGDDIDTDPFDLNLTFFGGGFTEVTSLTTAAGDFTFAGDRLTAIDEDLAVAIVALFNPLLDPQAVLAPSYTDDDGNEVAGDIGMAGVSVGVVPVPPAVAFSLTALAGLAAFRRRRVQV